MDSAEVQPKTGGRRRRRAAGAFFSGLVGAVIGGPLGYVAGAIMAGLLFCRNGGGAYGESCGMGLIIVSFMGIPFGAAIGATLGVYAVLRQSPEWTTAGSAVPESAPAARER